MAGVFSKPKTSKVEPLPPTPTKDDPAVEEARRKELVALSKQRGRQATILTGGQGDTSRAPVARKSALGA